MVLLVSHPRGKSNLLVVGGGSHLSMYEWSRNEIRHLSSRSDMALIKCLAWSPDQAVDDLFAVGLSAGRVDLLRLEASKSAPSPNGLFPTGPVVSLPARNSRSCNALAFSDADPNYLAVGLDKVRGDPSLTVWDVHASLPTLDISPAPHDPSATIARADLGPRADPRVLQQHAQTEVVSALAFLPQSTHLLLAGISARWLRLFDLRTPIPPTTNVASKVSLIATNPTDPNHVACAGDATVTIWDIRRLSNPLLTFSEKDAAADGARPRPAATIHHIQFSPSRRGQLATMEKDANYVRFWDLRNAHPAEGDPSRDPAYLRMPRRSWTNLAWTAPSGLKQSLSDSQDPSVLLLADTRKTKHFPRPLASFTLVPQSHPFSLISEVMVVNKDGDLELHAVHDTPKQLAWSARGDLAIGIGRSHNLIPAFQGTSEPYDVSKTTPTRHDQFPFSARPHMPDIDPSGARTYSPASFRHYPLELSSVRGDPSAHLDSLPHEQGKKKPPRAPAPQKSTTKPPLRGIHQIVEQDISMLMRHRAIRGYGIKNLSHNVDMMQEDPTSSDTLSTLWKWIRHSRNLTCIPTSRIHGYDFSNQGLMGIWEGFSPSSESRTSTSLSAPLALDPGSPSSLGLQSTFSQSFEDLSYGDFNAAITAILSRQGVENSSWSPALRTSKSTQRELALQLCGWYVKSDDLSDAIKKWEKDGQQSRAACWLVFTRQYTRALELLMRSKDEMHHLMTGTLAALIPGGTPSSELRDHSERLIVRLQDPYFRAMLTQLTSKDWSEVLEEEALPLRERLAIAFQYLEDRALSLYLHRTAERAAAKGDIEGLVITGLTPAGIDVLQTYVDRTGDVQTAAILSCLVCPAKFVDVRAERWLEAYRDLLDRFRLFHHRVRLDVERGEVLQEAVQNGELPLAFEWAPKQVLIRCNYCSKPMHLGGIEEADENTNKNKSNNNNTNNTNNNATVAKGRPTACPNCHRSIPRCAVCLMTLSMMPDVHRNAELLNMQVEFKDTIEDAIVICQTCRHGGHASHILDWFFGEESSRARGVCPVADCDCRCGDEF